MLHLKKRAVVLSLVYGMFGFVCLSVSADDVSAAEADQPAAVKPALEQAAQAPETAPETEASPPASATTNETSSELLKEGDAVVPEGAVCEEPTRDLWRVGAGVLWRSLKTRSWHGASYARNYPLANQAAAKSAPGPGGTYKDGHVRGDAWTGMDGDTWNWGYDSSSQVEGNALRLTSHKYLVTDYDRKTSSSESRYSDSGENEPGIYVFAQREFCRKSNWNCGLHLDFMRIASSVSGTAENFRDEQRWKTREERRIDVYSLDGTGYDASSEPYHGNFEGPGPCIPVAPLRSSTSGGNVVDEGVYTAFNAIKHDLDLQLLTFSLGLSLNYQFRRLTLGGAVGPTINIAETDAAYMETLYGSRNGAPASVLKEWRDTADETETLFGCFVQADAGLRITRRLELGLFGRYDWLGNITCDVGPSSYVVNPEGGSLGGSLSLVF